MAETLDTDDSFAARLSLALKALNFSRGQLASAVGVDKSLISRWLSGQVVPTSHNLARISDTLAKLKPGFNMILWERPFPEFEMFFGVAPAAPAPPSFAESEWGPIIVDPPRTATPFRWMVLGTLAGMVVIAAVAVYALTAPSSTAPTAPPPTPAAQPAPAPNSIAVLPFVNMSGDAANDYFSDGVSEEILNELANTPNLRVVARTSSFAFKGTRAGIAEIGRKLNVRAVLEGSVREEGNQVRITAQLVNAADGFHIWSQTYDRDLGDMLKVQSEIAHAIARALTQKIAATNPVEMRQVSADAYRKYLQAKFRFERRDFDAAIQLLSEAIGLQPDFAEAHALKAFALMNKMLAGPYNADSATIARIDSEVKQALATDPNDMSALYVSFHGALSAQDWQNGTALLARMRAINPGHPLTLRAASLFDATLGFPDWAVRDAELATHADPISLATWFNYLVFAFTADRPKEAISAGENALALQSDFPDVLAWLCLAYHRDGQVDHARVLAARLKSLPGGKGLVGCEIAMAKAEGRRSDVLRMADERAAHYKEDGVDEVFVGESYLDGGDYKTALTWFHRSYDAGRPAVFSIEYDRTLPRDFFQAAGWQALKQRPRFRAWTEARARYAADMSHAPVLP